MSHHFITQSDILDCQNVRNQPGKSVVSPLNTVLGVDGHPLQTHLLVFLFFVFCCGEKTEKGNNTETTVRHAVSDGLCPRLTPSVMRVPQSSWSTTDLSYRQPSHKRAWALCEDQSINNQRAEMRRRHQLSFQLQEASKEFSAVTTYL